MSGVMAEKLNSETFDYIPQTAEMLSLGSPLAGWLLGLVAGLSQGSPMQGGRAKIARSLGCDKSSVSRILGDYVKAEEIKAEDDPNGKKRYSSVEPIRFGKGIKYYITPCFMCTKAFNITVQRYERVGKKTRGKALEPIESERRLTRSELNLLIFLYTECNYRKKGYYATIAELSKKLGCSEKTIERSLATLEGLRLNDEKLFWRTEKGKNGRKKKHCFKANTKELRKLINEHKAKKKTEKKAEKKLVKELDTPPEPKQPPKQPPKQLPKQPPKQTALEAHIEAVNAKAEREKFYAERRERAQTVADRFIAKANENARFKELTATLAKMNWELAKAEIYAPLTLPTLQEKQKAMRAERSQVLASLGIEEWQLLPQYQCKKCSDTGFTQSGIMCDCYRPK